MKLDMIGFSVLVVVLVVLLTVAVDTVSDTAEEIDSTMSASNGTSDIVYLSSPQTMAPVLDGITVFNTKTYNHTWLNFDGINDAVNISDQDIYSPFAYGNKSTVIIKFKFYNDDRGTGSVGNQFVINKGYASNYEWVLLKANSTYKTISPTIYSLNGVKSDSCTLVSGGNYQNDTWMTIGFTVDVTKLLGWFNGNFACSDSSLNSLNGTGAAAIQIGSRATSTTFFNGSVDYVKYYTAPLGSMSMFNETNPNVTAIPVLMHHYFVDDAVTDNDAEVNYTNLIMELNFLNDSGYHTITDVEYYNWTQGTFTLPSKPIIIVWDDGKSSVINNVTNIMARYGYRGVAAVVTSYINTSSYMNWSDLRNLTTVWNWSIASHSDSHCSLGITDNGTTGQWCNGSTMLTNLSVSKAKIINEVGYTPITFIHPYNDWTNYSMANCSLNYTLCFGSASSETNYHLAKFIKLTSNFTDGNLTRIEISNVTSYNTLNFRLNYSYNTESLAGYWEFNENNGTTGYDQIGWNNATIIGASWADDHLKHTWIKLEENDNITIPTKPSYSPNNSLNQTTISFWVNMGDWKFRGQSATDSYTNFFRKVSNGYTACELEFRMENATGWDDYERPCRVSIYVFNSSKGTSCGIGTGSYFQDNDSLTSCTSLENTWINIVGKINETSTAIYKNGVMRDTDIYVGKIELNASSANITIGSDGDSKTGKWDGSLDNIMIYNRSLTDDEIAAIYASGRSGSPVSTIGLVGYWKINESSGLNLIDSISYNNATATNLSWQNETYYRNLTESADYSIEKGNGLFTILKPDFKFGFIMNTWSYQEVNSEGSRDATILKLVPILLIAGVLTIIYLYIKNNLDVTWS